MVQLKIGVKPGYHHTWRYSPGMWKETKIRPGTWKFKYSQTKTRTKPARIMGFPKGGRIVWRINALQFAKKINMNQYKITTVGTKRLVTTNTKRPNK